MQPYAALDQVDRERVRAVIRTFIAAVRRGDCRVSHPRAGRNWLSHLIFAMAIGLTDLVWWSAFQPPSSPLSRREAPHRRSSAVSTLPFGHRSRLQAIAAWFEARPVQRVTADNLSRIMAVALLVTGAVRLHSSVTGR